MCFACVVWVGYLLEPPERFLFTSGRMEDVCSRTARSRSCLQVEPPRRARGEPSAERAGLGTPPCQDPDRASSTPDRGSQFATSLGNLQIFDAHDRNLTVIRRTEVNGTQLYRPRRGLASFIVYGSWNATIDAHRSLPCSTGEPPPHSPLKAALDTLGVHRS